MRVAIVGTRGVPAKYGGFETFAQEVSPLLADKGLEVTVFCDRNELGEGTYKGVKLSYSTTTKNERPLYYYYETLHRALKNNDIVIVTGTAGSFFYFLNLIYRKKIITNTDGVESRREKWSWLKRTMIKFSEYLSVKLSQHLIADSQGIKRYILDTYKTLAPDKVSVIEYGADEVSAKNVAILKEFGLSDEDYYLVVARLEPENNIKMIVDAFSGYNCSCKLAVVGSLVDTSYVKELQRSASANVLFVGGIYNKQKLEAVRKSAKAYIHGHSVGGTNPSLLEALGCSNICLCHSNIYNREVTKNEMLYFSSSDELLQCVQQIESLTDLEKEDLQHKSLQRVVTYYNWARIADSYYSLITNI